MTHVFLEVEGEVYQLKTEVIPSVGEKVFVNRNGVTCVFQVTDRTFSVMQTENGLEMQQVLLGCERG